MTYYKNSHGHNQTVINGVGRIGVQFGGKAALWDDETMADVFVEKTDKFIEKHKDDPFFLYFSSQDIHVPRMPHPRFRGKSELTYRGDAMVQLDWATGAVMDMLDKHGLTENTIFVFSSDNGTVYDDGYQDGTTVKTSSKESDRGHDGSGPTEEANTKSTKAAPASPSSSVGLPRSNLAPPMPLSPKLISSPPSPTSSRSSYPKVPPSIAKIP